MSRAFLIFIFIFLSKLSFSEDRTSTVDSLNTLLSRCKVDTTKANLLNEISLQYYEMDIYDKALTYANDAESLSQKLKYQKGLATSYKRIGAIQTQQGGYPIALRYFFKSLEIYQQIKDNKGIFLVYNNIGYVYYLQRDYPKALEYYFKADKNNLDKGLTYGNIGITYIPLQKYDSSLYFLKQAYDYYESVKDKNSSSTMLSNIGSVYESQQSFDSSLTYYFKSLLIKKEINDKIGICNCLGSIGDVLYKQEKYQQSLEYETKCLNLSKEINYLSSILQTEYVISEIYNKLNDYDNALAHYKLYTQAKDSMFNEENTKNMVRTEMNFEFKKKQEIEAQKLQFQKTLRNWFVVGTILLLIFSFFIFKGLVKTKKQKSIIEEQKKEVEEKKKEMVDNINYAQRIQKAILPSDEYIKNNFLENFILYRPKDIVSGDFYWAYKEDNTFYFATADCTGHGVSGAMMSMIGAQLLNEIVIEKHIKSPEKVLNTLRDEIIKALNQEGASEERKDGMDISFCKIIKYDGFIHNGIKLQCACANNPIYIVRNGEVFDVKPDKMPIGKYAGEEKSFTLHELRIQEGDLIYTLSDGFCDQFGGEKGKKLMSKRFKQWISELSNIDFKEVKTCLEQKFNTWIGKGEQIDDVTVFAIKT